MTMKTCLIVMVAVALAAGCSKVLGFKDPKLEDPSGSNTPDAALDAPPGACGPVVCPFGCDTTTSACRAGKLWVYMTTGSFLGDSFGGKDTPPSVRATSDALCFSTFSTKYMTRQCTQTRTHAVLSVSTADSLALMATMYTVPTTVPVHRADDDVLVANTWNDLTDTTKTPRAPVASSASAATEALGIAWTGSGGTSTCGGWTSRGSDPASANDNGVRAHTTLMVTTWMGRDILTCNNLARLLCVCWSGGQ